MKRSPSRLVVREEVEVEVDDQDIVEHVRKHRDLLERCLANEPDLAHVSASQVVDNDLIAQLDHALGLMIGPERDRLAEHIAAVLDRHGARLPVPA